MDFGKVTTCAHCGKQFKALLEKHDEQDCIDGLLAENARLKASLAEEDAAVTRLIEKLRVAEREREEARAEVKRKDDLILDFIEKHDCESVPEPGCRCGSCRIIDQDCPCKPFTVEARRIHAERGKNED